MTIPTSLRRCAWRATLAALTLALAAAHPAAAPGQVIAKGAEAPAESLDDILQTRGSITFRNTPLSEVVFSLSQIWRVNIVAGSGVEGEVSGVFENAPLAEVLEAVLGANGFSYRRNGQSLIILPMDKIGSDDPNLRSRTLSVPGEAEDVEAVLRAAAMLLGPRGQMESVPSNRSVLVLDTEERIQRVAEFFDSLRRTPTSDMAVGSRGSGAVVAEALPPGIAPEGPQVAYFAPQFLMAKDLSGPIADALGGAVVLSVLEEENRLMVIGSIEQLQLASQIVRTLDTPRPQVRITALIYDVELRRGEQLGIDWGKTLRLNGSFGGGTITPTSGSSGVSAGGSTGTTDSATAAAAAGIAITLGTLQDSFSLGSVIKALDDTRGAHLLADPTITVVDRQEASIKIVTKIPYQQLTQTQQGGNIGTTAFQEAGITLTVTPRIARDRTIQMKVRPEFSTLVEFINGQPLIDSRAAETDVRVMDRHTLVIGGLRRKQMRDSITGIPGLLKTPYIGRLFGAHDAEMNDSELIVFLRPEIVTPYDELRPRECSALCVGTRHLDGIPVADHRPLVPYCNDKHCVYHHPRENINAGSHGMIYSGAMEMIGGAGSEDYLPPLAPPDMDGGTPLWSEPLPPPREMRFAPDGELPEYQSSRRF